MFSPIHWKVRVKEYEMKFLHNGGEFIIDIGK